MTTDIDKMRAEFEQLCKDTGIIRSRYDDGNYSGVCAVEFAWLAFNKGRAAAEQDKQMLDWISLQDFNDLSFAIPQDMPHDGEYCVSIERGSFYGKTFRDAVDAAMKGQS